METNNKKNDRYVRWTIFAWTISIIFALFVWAFGRIDNTNRHIVEMRVLVGQTANDVTWLKEYFVNGNK